MKSYIQRMGRSLQLPVSVLPAAALLQGIGHYLPQNWPAATFLQGAGNAILGQLALLFAVGLALGMSEDNNGAAALAGVVAYFVPITVCGPDVVSQIQNISKSSLNPAYQAIEGNVFIGIIAGLIAAAMYNRFHNTKLPMALSFFSGRRLAPIMAAFVMALLSVVLYFVWPFFYDALVSFGKFMVGLGAIGAGLFGFFNRLLIPTGLHQALNSVFWFNIAGIDDIHQFWSSKGTTGVTGMYLAGFFPIMMFGLPAGAYAMYRNAFPERKKDAGSMLFASSFAAIFTGVTEPLEFSFMFTAWPLYLVHAVLTGCSLALAASMHWIAGFTFSAGLVDYTLSFRMPKAHEPWMLLVQGILFAIIYYILFDFCIKKFNLATPGREPLEENGDEGEASQVQVSDDDDKYMVSAKIIYAGLGGADNITAIDNCTTRLRLQLVDTDKVNQATIRQAKIAGINVLDKTNIQVIVGTEVQFVADALKQLFEAKAPIETGTTAAKAEAPAAEEKSEFSGQSVTLNAGLNGELINLDQVDDPTFAQKMIGDGFAINPSDGQIVAPVDAEITTVFPTKHALGLKTSNGLEVLIHMGIDTVELNGAGFDVQVAQGDQVKAGQPLAQMDLKAIETAGKKTTVMVIITNMIEVSYLRVQTGATVTATEAVAEATHK
ncbi:PTS transporter subunit EIIC [Lactobacillus sp. DCY120]|uniref:PTS transporter subunit EIIC n=1 Tax=Bombilactobacillus apium TaxID=2675299 RepID=A0A850R8U1_9LACO|nr:N-acetylglucosamine-specific PTS transporter subunit IIBC [Bombilactobacillus apium]NVY96945.1 PTS transporter subunit EIIC [Bombilactobacillus apium]